jgi:septum formation protein
MKTHFAPPTLVLASSSSSRVALLERLGLPFEIRAPNVNETPLPAEQPEQLVSRLAEAKARAVGIGFSKALVIDADQVALLGQDILGKPGTYERAVQQLRAASGRKVNFYTGLCVLNTATGQTQTRIEIFQVQFRHLTEAQIEHYLQREQPYQCAGSFRSEGLGIALFKHLRGDDPTTLIGLPLIRLTELLAQEGYSVL